MPLAPPAAPLAAHPAAPARPQPVPSPDPSPDPRRARARRGEFFAACYLRLRGYRIIARNLRTPFAEVDLLVRRGRALVLVEVKTLYRPAHSELLVRLSQQRRLARAAAHLAAERGAREVRIDLIVVTVRPGLRPPGIRHLPGAWGGEVIEGPPRGG